MFNTSEFLIVIAVLLLIIVFCTLPARKRLKDIPLSRKMRKAGIDHPLHVVYCYALVDASFAKKIDAHLSVWKRLGIFDTWDQRNVLPGTKLEPQIDAHLRRADMIVLLVSADFLDSDDCIRQANLALERCEREHVIVVPVIVRHVAAWRDSPIGKLEPLLAEPISAWEDPDEPYKIVSQKLGELSFVVLTRKKYHYPPQTPFMMDSDSARGFS